MARKLRFQIKVGKGNHYHEGVKYKAGDILEVEPEVIKWADRDKPGGCCDKFVCLDELGESEKKNLPVPNPEKKLKLQRLRKGIHKGLYNVINVETEECLNDQPLTEKEAEAIIDAGMDGN